MKYTRTGLKHSFKTPEAGVVLLAVVSLIVLFNPFSEAVLAVVPVLPFLAAFTLFMVPGLVLAFTLLPGPDLAGLARAPVAFVLSVGVYGLTALPELVLTKSVVFYPVICAVILVLSLGLAVLRIVRGNTPAEGEEASAKDLSTRLLWVPFALATGALAWISSSNVPRPAEDAWIYLSRVRDLLESGSLGGGFSRLMLNGWLPEQSVLSLVSGLDPIVLVLQYLAPTLVVMSLLALYALARTLLQNEKATLTISSLAALFFLVVYSSASLDSVLAPGGEFLNRITEDKYVARYVFLPVALSLAIIFMRDQSWRNLGLFFFICLAVAVVHPLGLVFIGIPIAGFGVLHVAISWRDREARLGVGKLWLTLLVITGPPALYLLATGNPLLFREDAVASTDVTLLETAEYERHVLEIWEGSYTVHPSLLLDPAMLVAYLLGVPFLIWKIKRAENTLVARLLLGTLVFTLLLTFVPYISTLISDVIGPWMLHRLTWPLLLAALLTLGWMCWEALRFVASGLSEINLARPIVPFLPLIVVGFLLVDVAPITLSRLQAAGDEGKTAQGETTCADPTFRWIQENVPASGRVIAPRSENACITAYAGSVDVLGIRGQIPPRAQQDLTDFFTGPALGPEALEILQRREIGYVLLPINSPLNEQLEHLPDFARMDNPGERYRMYEVVDGEAPEPSPVIGANGDLNDEEWDAAIEAYSQALEEDDPENAFLAYLGLGRAYAGKEQYTEAVASYQAALALDPESSAAYELLASAYDAAGAKDQARTEFEQGIELDPGNADLRLKYGQFLVPLDGREAVEQHLAVVERFPRVPEYRVKLGSALMLAGATAAADQEFERAVRLSPLSARLRADIGGANLLVGRPEQALPYYQSAFQLDPNSQAYALNLGRVHAQLSTQNGRDEEHFKEAEAYLKRVEDLGHQPWEPDYREAAWITLGDLYLEWDRPEDAASAYERALELDPDSEEAQEKLQGLQ